MLRIMQMIIANSIVIPCIIKTWFYGNHIHFAAQVLTFCYMWITYHAPMRFILSDNSGTALAIRRDRLSIILDSAWKYNPSSTAAAVTALAKVHTCGFPTWDYTDIYRQFHQIIQMKFTKEWDQIAWCKVKDILRGYAQHLKTSDDHQVKILFII